MKTIAFFNPANGIGKTFLCIHVAFMLKELGFKVMVADLDPQAELRSYFTSWAGLMKRSLVYERFQMFAEDEGWKHNWRLIFSRTYPSFSDGIVLLASQLKMSLLEDSLGNDWYRAIYEQELNGIWRTGLLSLIIDEAGRNHEIDYCLVDFGSNLGPLNRSGLLAADAIITPVGIDKKSIWGLKHMGNPLRNWKESWQEGTQQHNSSDWPLSEHAMENLGYVVMQTGAQNAHPNWIDLIPQHYHTHILQQEIEAETKVANDPRCLSMMEYYHSLLPLAKEARKPIFALKPADGAIGGHIYAVQKAYQEFKTLTEKIVQQLDFAPGGK